MVKSDILISLFYKLFTKSQKYSRLTRKSQQNYAIAASSWSYPKGFEEKSQKKSPTSKTKTTTISFPWWGLNTKVDILDVSIDAD